MPTPAVLRLPSQSAASRDRSSVATIHTSHYYVLKSIYPKPRRQAVPHYAREEVPIAAKIRCANGCNTASCSRVALASASVGTFLLAMPTMSFPSASNVTSVNADMLVYRRRASVSALSSSSAMAVPLAAPLLALAPAPVPGPSSGNTRGARMAVRPDSVSAMPARAKIALSIHPDKPTGQNEDAGHRAEVRRAAESAKSCKQMLLYHTHSPVL